MRILYKKDLLCFQHETVVEKAQRKRVRCLFFYSGDNDSYLEKKISDFFD